MKLLFEGARRLGIELTAEQLAAFQTYYQELIAWNKKFNLTAITDYEEVQIWHFLDSLTCLLALEDKGRGAPLLPSFPSVSVIDVGTGAGFPGLPLKIVRPELRLTLLEARGKKVAFLEHLVRRLGLEDVKVVKGRAEKWGRDPAHRERYDLALARALAELPILVEYALPFCRLGGLLIAQKGAGLRTEVEAAGPALDILGGALRRIIPVELPGLAQPRSLVVIEKVAPTPEKYPRRPGIPRKRPIKS